MRCSHLNRALGNLRKVMYAVIVENDVSQWDDDTGVLYHFPKRYLKYLQPGTHVIYYKGRIKDKAYQVPIEIALKVATLGLSIVLKHSLSQSLPK